MRVALFLLLTIPAFGAAVLTDDVYQLPPGEWRWVPFEIHHRPATAECRFETTGGGEVSAELVSRPELELIRQHKHHDSLALTDSAVSGSFSHYIEDPGDYAVVIQNEGKQTVAVRLNVALTFGVRQPVSQYLSPTRRLTVILSSFATFFAIVTVSARALLRAMKRP